MDVMTADLVTRRELAFRAAAEQGLIGSGQPVIGLLDMDGVRQAAAELRAVFNGAAGASGARGFNGPGPGTGGAGPGPGTDASVRPGVLHAFAVKAASLVPVLRLLAREGLGAEVASPGELAVARAAGMPSDRIVLDSPAKTVSELREALALGIAVNADNPAELARLDALVPGSGTASPIGLRVNPQIGSGSIGAMSTATATSKFGVPMRDEGAEDWLVRAFADRPWLTRLHSHTGSQGVALELMTAGVRAVYELAERINTATGRRRITAIDIGGGLPVNVADDTVRPGFRAYADALRAAAPGLFDGRYGLVTEFGRSLVAKQGAVLARVEYAKSAGGRAIAVTHAGAQLAARTAFAPDAWPVRVQALDPAGRRKPGPPVVQDVAGPCCFAGDLLARGRELPLLAEGDLVAVLDTGGYYFSTHFAYNSLPRPAVYGFSLPEDDGPVRFEVIRRAQTTAELVTESGG
jgi:diaminopimelate decarboxylase